MRASPLSLLLLLGLGACSWVGKADYDARLGELDDDADGVPAARDCDDHDATINPSVQETWYDGIDESCDGGDDYDQDLDGNVPEEYLGLPTAGVDGSGALPGGDCDDTNPRVSPQQPDTWYDGVDQDCNGADDFDRDGDGYVPIEHAGALTQYVDGSGALPGGDCDDLLEAVHPGAADDWYDGVDSDCAGNDDWDQDGDGFIPDDRYDDYGPTTYVDDSGGLPNGDCDDTDAAISPVATDTWYDDIDSDCMGDDDYDQDGDGFPVGTGPGDDCDDTEPAAYPGALEVLGDGEDYDCDGGDDTFALDSLAGFTWAAPHDPVFDESSDRVYLSIAAAEVDTGSVHYYDSAIALLWLNDDPGDGRDGVAAWSSNLSNPADYALGAGQGFVATDDYLYGVLGLDYGDHRSMRLVRYDVNAGTRTAASADGTDGLAPYADISVVLDSAGDLHAIGCEDDTNVLQYIRVPNSWSGGFSADVEVPDISTADCALDLHEGAAGAVYTSERGGVWTYGFDSTAADPTFTETGSDLTFAPLDLDIPADWSTTTLVMADATSDSVVLLDTTGATIVGAHDLPTEVDAVVGPGGTLYVAYVVPGGDVHLAWGTGATGFTEVELAVDFAVEDVAVWVSGSYVMVGATGADNVAVGLAGI
jgi:hypothetical protein